MPIEEKIESLIQWMKKYPKAQVGGRTTNEVLREYAQTEEEYERLVAEFETMKNYYEYIRSRKSKNKLPRELLIKCKEGNVRGVFGYPTKTEELARKNGTSEKNMDYIICKYGSIEHFVTAYRTNELDREDLNLASSILKSVVDIDFGTDSRNYDRLYEAIMQILPRRHWVDLYSSENLKAAIQTLKPQQIQVLEKRYGLTTEEKGKTLGEIGEELNISMERVRQVEAKALRMLIHPARRRNFCYYSEGMEEEYGISESEKEGLRILIDNLYANHLLVRNPVNSVPTNNPEIAQGIELVRNFHRAILERSVQKKEPVREEAKRIEIPANPPTISERKEEGIVAVEKNDRTAELEEARRKRAELQAQVKGLEGKLAEAKTLMQVYEELLGEKEGEQK